MLRLLTLIATFFIGRYNSAASSAGGVSVMPIVELAMIQGRKVALLICSSLIFSLLMVGGFFITLIEGSFAYEAEGVLYPTTLFKAGLLLFLVSVGSMIFIFARKQNWSVTPLESKKEERTSHPIEDAVLMLIHDFVKERESRRQARAEYRSEYAAAHEPRAGEPSPRARTTEMNPEALYN